MAVKIRLRRMGRKKRPLFGIVAADSRSPRDGRYIEDLGRYNPLSEPATVDLPPGGLNLSDLERDLVVQALRRSRGNRTIAGSLLGLNRDQVRYRIEKYGIAVPSADAEERA